MYRPAQAVLAPMLLEESGSEYHATPYIRPQAPGLNKTGRDQPMCCSWFPSVKSARSKCTTSKRSRSLGRLLEKSHDPLALLGHHFVGRGDQQCRMARLLDLEEGRYLPHGALDLVGRKSLGTPLWDWVLLRPLGFRVPQDDEF